MDALDLLVERGASALRPGGLLALEVGASQADSVMAALQASGCYGAAQVVRDLAHRERMILVETISSDGSGSEGGG